MWNHYVSCCVQVVNLPDERKAFERLKTLLALCMALAMLHLALPITGLLYKRRTTHQTTDTEQHERVTGIPRGSQ